MEHFLLILAEFVLALGAIGVFLVVALVLVLGMSAKYLSGLFGSGRQGPAGRSEADLLRQRLIDAQTTAYESAVASEKIIQELQRKLRDLEAERSPGFVSLRR